MASQEAFFSRLTRLFRSGPAIQRRVKGYDAKSYYSSQIIQGNYGYRAGAPFGFGRSSSPFSVLGSYGILDRMARYAEFGEMEYCLHGDTKIAVPGGYKTLKELSEEFGTEKEFIVYSYDHNKQKIVPALGKQARKTRTDHAWKVTFDNGKEIIGTSNHRLMKRDGTYCEIGDLKSGDAMMPFYRKSLLTQNKKEKENEYLFIYNMDFDKTKSGWRSEHRIVAEWAYRDICKNEIVHHKNFIKSDNRPENLQIMDKQGHASYHAKLNNEKKWSDENADWIKAFKQKHSLWMKENNPAERKDVTFSKILQYCELHGFNLYKVSKAFDTDPNVIKRKLAKNGYDNFITFSKAYKKNWRSDSWNNSGDKNPRFNSSVSFEAICNQYQNGMTLKEISEHFNVSVTPIKNRLRENGYSAWSEFTSTYQNLKVEKIEYYGVIDLYDLTVDGYKNFATDTVVSHNTPEISTALDIYSDEIVGGDDRGKCFHVFSSNAQIKKELDDLFYDVLNIEFNAKVWVRNLLKYGDFFLYNEVLPDIGVVNATPIAVNEIERQEGFDIEDPYAVRFKWVTRGNKYLENWQILHLRLLGNDLFLPYGTSILESARRIWRQLVMLEDAMLVYRVVRSPERRVFFIDVGNIDPNDVPNYMEAAKATLKSSGVVDKQTGREDMRLNTMSVLDDYFIPVRGAQQGTRVETLSGGQHVTATEDVEYIQRKMFAALKVPKPYMNFDENLSAKASLAQMDVRFSRTIQAMQKIVIAELNKLAMIHLYSKGFDGADLIDFELKLSNPSSVALQQKLELWSVKFDIGGTAKETGLVDSLWIQKNILELTNEEISVVETGLRKDKLRDMEIEAMELQEIDETQPAKTTDIFDPTNYQIPGKDVPKSPMKKNAGGDVEIRKFRSYDDDGHEIVDDLEKGKTPIKATPFLTRHKKNRTRRLGVGRGRHNTAMPDLSAMLSQRNKYTKDVYGQKTEALDASKINDTDLLDFGIRIDPHLGKEMKGIFKNLESHLNLRKTEVLSEQKELDIDIDLNELHEDDDTLKLFENFELKDEFEGENDTVEETSLKEVFEDES